MKLQQLKKKVIGRYLRKYLEELERVRIFTMLNCKNKGYDKK